MEIGMEFSEAIDHFQKEYLKSQYLVIWLVWRNELYWRRQSIKKNNLLLFEEILYVHCALFTYIYDRRVYIHFYTA